MLGVQTLMVACTLGLLFVFTSCYHQGQQTPDAWNLAERQIDSIGFNTTHHYAQNYNFIVKADSLTLIEQHPAELLSDMPVDSITVRRGDQIVVADISTLPTDTVDSIWVRVARDEYTMGWIHERDMLPGVKPADTISQFIDFFSNTHLLIFLAFIIVVGVSYLLRQLLRHNAYIVHLRDIDSVYPMMLALLVAISATLYSTIQLFGAETWRHFYYHPTLNPLAVPPHIGLFLISVWAIVIVAIAAIDDTRKQLHGGDMVLYLLGLAAVCAVNYIVFSVSTLYYVGYLLLVVYCAFAIGHYLRRSHVKYVCGHCGKQMHRKGTCPRCGAQNI